MCDLHIHSLFSDSDASVESIFAEAAEKKLSAISITDHDSIDGLTQAKICSKKYNVELIEGIELSAHHNRETEVHVLGYFFDSNNQSLKEEAEKIKQLRRDRLAWMADRLNLIGLAVDKDELFRIIGPATPTRLHLGLYLVGKKIVSSLKEAFGKYLSPGRPAFRSRFKYSVKEAVELIKKYGGLAFLAHPHMIGEQAWVEEFVEMGIDGLEIIYPRMTKTKQSFYLDMAKKLNLLKSGGSDAHGTYKEFNDIGCVTIPYEWVEEMKGRITNNK